MEREGASLGGALPAIDGVSPSIVMAAHELKAPLALVRQLALTLQEGGNTPAGRAEILSQITLVSERALRLTSDLTRSVRLQDTLFNLEPLNPQQICEDVAHELSPLYRAHGRQIIVRPRRSQLVVANRELLRRVMLGFGDNALYYADSNHPTEFKTTVIGRGAHVRVAVRDYGPAVPTDVWRRLMASLQTTGYQPLHARPQSSGLGLHIARSFASAMNGNVGAVRHHNGASFYVDLLPSTQLSLL